MTTVDDALLERLARVPLAGVEEELLLAAMLGADDLAAVVGGGLGPSRAAVASDVEAAAVSPAGAYLTSVTVEGFRGVGPAATLTLEAGPGLTVVCGRNGSGKSSFAEALEVLLTGRIRRLEGRPAVWQDAWRCLHAPRAEVSAGLAMVGVTGEVRVTATWDGDARAVTDGKVVVRAPGDASGGVDRLGWGKAMELHRPFLSHSELEVMLSRPSELYDQLNALLGLDDLAALTTRLGDARKQADQVAKAPAGRLPRLRTALGEAGDARAHEALTTLAGKSPDLGRLAQLATGTATTQDPALAVLDRLRQLPVPTPGEVASAATALDEAAEALEIAARANAADADATARLLAAALDHYGRHGPGDCPVCGRRDVLDDSWLRETTDRVEHLRRRSEAIRGANALLADATTRARPLVQPLPEALAGAEPAGLDPAVVASARQAWTAWATLPASPDAPAVEARRFADHLRASHPGLAAAAALAGAAAAAHTARKDRWTPVAAELFAWCNEEADARAAREIANRIKKVEDWLKAANDELRNERLSPYVDGAKKIWSQLRQESNVDVVGMTLTGAATRRAVDIAVTIDGDQPGNVGVLSQGEINALALSVFLPRATSEHSPLRFVVIDDPVQAMDPSKVDGMARVLVEAARDRQVVVFTHDDRLPAALRNLDLPARIIQVVRRPGSVVELHPGGDPAEQHLNEARNLLAGDGIPQPVAARVIPNLCRTAIEETCFEIVRRRRLRRGDTHQDVEDALLAAKTLMTRLALAIFDDSSRGGEVYSWLNRRLGPWAADAARAVNEGSHGAPTNHRNLVEHARDLTGKLRAALP
jgi:recombinational DNA repair ATPase RecF